MKTNRVCLLISFLLALAASAADTGRGVAVEPVTAVAPGGNAGLFVGVNQFTEDKSLRSLDFAVNDAIAQAHLFVVELKLIPPANTYLALSGEPTTATAKTELAALEKTGVRRISAVKSSLLRTVQTMTGISGAPADMLVVSLSSHGFEERGIAYVMPADGIRGFLEDSAVNLNSVEQRLAQSKAGKRLLLVDACREKPGTEGKGADAPMTSAFRSALAVAEGQAVLASCDAGQISLENLELGHGVFTHFLLKALRGEATADARGFITLGAVSDYVAQSVHGWVARNRPALDRRAVQQPWFKGPKIAEQIPLAVDPGIRARLGSFKQEILTMVSALRGKINRKGEFTTAVYERLADALEQAQDDDAGRRLLERSKDFASGKLTEDVFVVFLERVLETPEQRSVRLKREAAERQARERTAKIASLLATAQANDNKENGKTALAALDELLKLDPAHRVALTLRAKIGAYYGPNAGDTKTLDLGRGVKMELVWIPPGEFMMGEGGEAHRMKLTIGFWLGKYEVTQEQYEVVIGSNPSKFKEANNPVEMVSWDDALAFCHKVGARLPTQAEWEYACRGGTTTKYHSGDAETDLARVGWYSKNSDHKTHPVGGKQANAWGLHDMHANVWEWCADWYGEYPNAETTNPTGPGSGQARFLRGGSWIIDPDGCRSALRYWGSPVTRDYGIGFRVAVDFR